MTLANGSKVLSKFSCTDFQWEKQGERFAADLRFLKLGGCDIVLGVGQMRTVSRISFDFNKSEITIEKDRRKLTLVGYLDMGLCKLITG